MEKEQTRYSRLAHITKLINTKLELRPLLEHVITAISEEVVRCDSVGIYLPQEDGKFRGYVGKPEVINGMTLDMHVVDTEYDLLAKEVIETQRTIYIPDTAKDNRPDPRAVAGFGIKSLLALPVSYEGELFGLVFLFDYGIPMDLTAEEIQTVEAYVNMAGVAIRNVKNLHRKENLLSEKQLLLDLTRDLSMSSSMSAVMEKCFHYVGKVLKNDNIGVHLLDPLAGSKIKPSNLSAKSEWEEEEWLEKHTELAFDPSNDMVFDAVVRTKKPLHIPDVTKDERVNQEVCKSFGIEEMLMLPFVSMGEVLGALVLVNFDKNNQVFHKSDIELAQSIADATASTLANLLYMEKQEVLIEDRTSEILLKNNELELVVTQLENMGREKELILNSVEEGIFGLDLEGKITFCNRAADFILGYSKGELIGQSYKLLLNKDEDLTESSSSLKEDLKFRKKDGVDFSVEYVASSIKENGNIIGDVVTFRDITKRKQLENEISHLAYYDHLTDLPNRILLNDFLNKEIDKAKVSGCKVAVLYLDLDRFKIINDSMGHSYGDAILQDVANRLSRNVPDMAFLSRQGGDEFTIILPGFNSDNDVLHLVDKLVESFAEPFSLKDTEVHIKTSIGISLFPKDGDTAEVLIKNADAAMYKSKEKSGTYHHFFRSEMSDRNLENIFLENALYKALENEELCIHYQPQIDSRTNSIIGAEALLRWNHPTRGMVSPINFIPTAEETGLIVPIGKWVLLNACKQLKVWHAQGNSHMTVSVNLSGRQFEEDDLLSMIESILVETGIPPECLHIELTENQIFKNTYVTLEKMREIKMLGVKISLDDFGTGYSSLGYLKNFPIDTLKIDRSFMFDILTDKDNAAITSTIITLAQNLDLDVIAEGVETKEQLDFLMARSCFNIQGYYFSKPLDAKALDEFMNQISNNNRF
ncbi:diguanylate cyclase (GGDEF)-like protein/PAS domain S-box-containing protein [Planomicrobium stackebrandtii]|uniref:Diguanylate cyclase (GGDEF)-like protein/PAS domain S-box-containing protein n=1 Tax=Planomicrobium stackebrandtii TaxID=253160 RepID=A0ABU0GT37_9BACL|nr:EAL domain-containing protein [Planomicrobium stackebrandtii]MDQ0428516.1 diguanylate cyclase (GGDEF)-like protein/PAS domain S-box-containing protein [Planomicrobium stackebrandtii]